MLTIIGDVHGKFSEYVSLVREIEGPSLQLGDMGFRYDRLVQMSYDNSLHKFFGGNHDNYDWYYENWMSGHALDDYGIYEAGGVKALYIRGAFSIDWKIRKAREFRLGKSWWQNEELNYIEGMHALDFYEKHAHTCDVVVTHSCPQEISRRIGNPGALRQFNHDPETFTTNTQQLLQQCFEIHQPQRWVFGHFHKDWHCEVNGTMFSCVPELVTLEIGG